MGKKASPIFPGMIRWRLTGPKGESWAIGPSAIYGIGELPGFRECSWEHGDWPGRADWTRTRHDRLRGWLALGPEVRLYARVDVLRHRLRQRMNPRSPLLQQRVRLAWGELLEIRDHDEDGQLFDGALLWRLLHGWTLASGLACDLIILPELDQYGRRVRALRLAGAERYGLLATMAEAWEAEHADTPTGAEDD